MTSANSTIPGTPVDPSRLPPAGVLLHHPVHGDGVVTGTSDRFGEPVVKVFFGGSIGMVEFLIRNSPLSYVDAGTAGPTYTTDLREFDQKVVAELNTLRVRKAAQELLRSQNEPEIPGFDAGLLGEILARPAEPAHRVRGLIQSDAGTLVVAMRKTGKTTFKLNLARCLITGEMFLDRFEVRPIAEGARVGFLNFEVSAGQLGRWADEVGIPHDRFFQVNLRGRRNPLGREDDRGRLADLLREHTVESLIVDPFGRAYTGGSQNDSGEVGAFLADLDRFARGEVGAVDVILAAHAGWNGERTRGASALEDWADTIVTLTADDEKTRFMRAEGRDVDFEEDQLHFDPARRWLSVTGMGSRKQASTTRKLDDRLPSLLSVVERQPGASVAEITTALRAPDLGLSFHDRDITKTANLAQDRGLIRRVQLGIGRKTQHFRITPSDPVQPRPQTPP